MAHPVAGLLIALCGSLGLSLGAILADLRDEAAPEHALHIAANVLPAATVLLYGYDAANVTGDTAPHILALGLVLLAILGERALGRAPRQLWWGSAPAYLALLWLGSLIASPVVGLGLAAVYAGTTLAAAIERLRRLP
jgi:hypothetical protein